MKNLSLLLLSILVFSSCGSGEKDKYLVLTQKSEYDAELMKREKISNLQIREYEYKFGVPDESGEGFLSLFLTFGEDGHYLNYARYSNTDYMNDLIFTRQFEKVSNKLSKTTIYDVDGNLESTTWVTMDGEKELETVSYDADSVFESKMVYKYDEADQLVEGIGYNNLNEPDHRIVAKYDEHGELIEQVHYKGTGEIRYRRASTKLSRLMRKWEEFDEAGDVSSSVTLTFDESGRLLREQYDSKYGKNELEYIYEGDSPLIRQKIQFNEEGKPEKMFKYIYTKR